MKLQGIKVVDLSAFLPGPYLTLAMADHGAEVTKIEPPGGEHGRRIGPFEAEQGRPPQSVFFRNLNRGKRSLVLDLKTAAGRAELLALTDAADVVVESYRPGVADRLGIGADTLCARNPRLVHCAVSAFGQSGPLATRPAHDLATVAMAGILGITLGDDGAPVIPGLPMADLLAALQGLSGVLMALLRRATTGRGDRIDISMHECALAGSLNVLGPTLAEDRQPVARHERTTGGAAFYRLYRTQDGRHLALAGQEEKFVRTLLGALGRPDLVPACLAGPGPHQAPVMAFLETEFATRPLSEWLAWLEGQDVCYGPVLTFPEALDHPAVQDRGIVITDEAGRRHIAPPIRFAEEPARPVLRAPPLGDPTRG